MIDRIIFSCYDHVSVFQSPSTTASEENVLHINLGLTAKIHGHLLVTAGGTTVPWDDVRRLGNTSKGGFGVSIANAAAERGVPVILLCTEIAKLKYWVHPAVTVVLYETFDEYVDAVARIARQFNVKYAISAAAVSDYGFEHIEGKIDSKEPVAPKIEALPKVLATWRTLFGTDCYITGFKLHASPRDGTKRENKAALDKLIAAADGQIKTCHLNLTCANFSPWKGNADTARGKKRLWLRRPDGGGIELLGTDRQVATALVDYILEQADVTWGRSTHVCDLDDGRMGDECFIFANRVLSFAQRSKLLHSRAGNVTVMAGTDHAWVSPRGLDKTAIDASDLCYVTLAPGQDTKLVYSSKAPEMKPSIDTRVYLMVSRMFPFKAAIHFHDAWVLESDAVTEKDYACGTDMAAGQLVAALNRAHKEQLVSLSMIELVRHGHTLFVLEDSFLQLLENNWHLVSNAYREHLEEIGMLNHIDELELQPIFGKSDIIGVAARHREDGWYSFFLHKDYRSHGIGAKLTALINERQVNVGVHRDCKVEDWYVDRGFEVLERREAEGLTILGPPSLRDNVVEAVTMTIVCPWRRTVLLGERALGAFDGYHANLGGKVDEPKPPHRTSEEKIDAWLEACREVREECGADLSMMPRPATSTVHYTRTMRGDREVVFRVTNFMVEVPEQFDVTPNEEHTVIDWYDIDGLDRLKRSHATRDTHRFLTTAYPEPTL
ncbi:MAG: class II aldolase/adducin family protein [Candidatus Uhrbacteria bacterium]|nr:class II aldolase/adducin family protein [Candidatus Uhrbacteria bacterium]